MAPKSGNGSAPKGAAAKKAKKANGSKRKAEGDGAGEQSAEAASSEAATGKASKGASKGKLHFESMLTRDEAASYFEAIVKGLRKGSIHFHQSEESLVLEPADHVGVEVKATRKSGREKLSFEVVWRTDKESELTILAGDAPPASESGPETAAAS